MIAESLVTLVGLLSIQAMPMSAMEPLALHGLPTAKYVPVATIEPPTRRNLDSLGVVTTARSAVVLDVKSGEFLLEKAAGEAHPIASITKLMTAMTFLDTKPNLDEEVTIKPEDDAHEGKAVFAANERLTKRDLLRALLVGSVNTAGYALARSTGDPEAFIRTMNAKAQTMQLGSIIFYDPTGLDARNKGSARDVARLLRLALAYPEIRDIAKLDKITFTGRASNKPYLIKSTNLLLDSFLNRDPYHIIAAKTGSLPEAGFCLAQATQNAAGNEVIAVVLGSENHFSRFQDAKVLTYWTFQNYEWPRMAANAVNNP